MRIALRMISVQHGRMGFFSRKQPERKPNPVVVVEGIQVEFTSLDGGDCEWWSFTHERADFVSYGRLFHLPAREVLGRILSEVTRLLPEMNTRLENGGLETGTEESWTIDLTELQAEGTYAVSWSGGEKWGDMGVDFHIKGGCIEADEWGD